MHEINWKEPEVVDSHPYYRQRCVLEAWHIRTEHQTMNCDEGPLPSEYNPLICQLRPAAAWLHYHDHCMLVTYCACADIIIATILILLLLLLLLFYHYHYHSLPHLTICHQFPPFLCIKTPADFCNIIFSHWWGPRIGSKRLNQVTSPSSCKNVLAGGVSDHYNAAT